MDKIKETLLIALAGLIFLFATGVYKVEAGILDTIKDTVTGHVDDIKSRFDKDRPQLDFEQSDVISRGTIDEDSVGQDFIHNSKGSVGIIKHKGRNYLVLGDNFKSSPGPDYHVYISYEDQIHEEIGFDETKQIEISKLNYGSGDQFYLLPRDIDVTKIKSFLLWCKAFGAFIGSAELNQQ